jgi:nucleoside-diphosphate-sugar epimerase
MDAGTQAVKYVFGRCLVTGASGFIGANLCRRLLDLGAEVHALVRPGSDRWRLAGMEGSIFVHEVDITDRTGLHGLVREVRPRIVYNLATHGAYSQQTSADKIILTNIFGLWNMITACEEVDYDLFVNTGSSSEYGFKDHAMRENDSLEPNSYYAVAKAAQSMLGQYYSRHRDRAFVTLRPFSVYGRYEESSRLFPTLMFAALDRRPIKMVSPDTSRDFIHIDDLLDPFLLVDKLAPLRSEVINIGSGVQTSMKDLVDIVSEESGSDVQAEWSGMEKRIWDTSSWVADVSKARRLLQWQPRITLREGVRDCLAWFGANGGLYKGRMK